MLNDDLAAADLRQAVQEGVGHIPRHRLHPETHEMSSAPTAIKQAIPRSSAPGRSYR